MDGGKLTGYRKMAEQIVDAVVDELKDEEGILYSHSETSKIPISGGDVGGSKQFPSFKRKKIDEGLKLGISEVELNSLKQTYGQILIFYFKFMMIKNPPH